MSARNRFPGKCCVCGEPVAVDAGYFVKGEGLKHAGCSRPRRPTRQERLEAWIARGQREAEANAQRHARELAAEHDAKNPFTR